MRPQSKGRCCPVPATNHKTGGPGLGLGRVPSPIPRFLEQGPEGVFFHGGLVEEAVGQGREPQQGQGDKVLAQGEAVGVRQEGDAEPGGGEVGRRLVGGAEVELRGLAALGQPELVDPHLAAQNVGLCEEQGLPGQVLLGEGRLSRQGVVFAQQAEEPRLADLLVPQAGSARLPQGDHPVQGPFPQPGEELDVRQGDQVGVQAGEPLAQPPQDLTQIADGSIDFDHVYFTYQPGSESYALSDIDLHIKAGETIGIIGGTGFGKSSLVNLISRLYDVSQGAVKVGGKDVRSYDLETLRDNVAVVLQKNVLFSGTILENLRWGKEDATLEECAEAYRLACADEFIERFPRKYDTWIDQGGLNVSGGQRQRLCIARALLKRPKVLILDDSTSAVDTATDRKIREAFAKHIPGTTKLIISQRVSSIQDADRILVLENGKIAGFGTHEELLEQKDRYYQLYTGKTA